jgi:hypothetical protein
MDWSNVRPEDVAVKTHRELYPQQYTHPLVGKTVRVHGQIIVVARVVSSRWGLIAMVEGDEGQGYHVDECREVTRHV